MLFYPATLPPSSKTLNYTAGVIRRHRRAIGSPPRRRLTPGRQALLVLACLRKATDTDRDGRAGTREDCDLTGTRGWTCCRLTGMQEVSGSSPLSSTQVRGPFPGRGGGPSSCRGAV